MNYKNLNILTLDFETYFDIQYTLKKMDTPLYVADPRFHIHGMAIDDKYYDNMDDIDEALNLIDWDNTALLCYNTAFDAYILHYHFDITPAYYLDALSMARPILMNELKSLGLDSVSKHLGYKGKTSGILMKTKGKLNLTTEESAEMGEYCLQDVQETIKVFQYLQAQIPPFEMDLIDTTIRMFANPKFLADIPRIKQEIKRVKNGRDKLFGEVQKLLPSSEDDVITVLRSADKFAETLIHNGIEAPTKVSPRTGKTAFAFAKTDLEFKAFEEHPNENIRLLRKARLASKSDNALNKAEKLLQYSNLYSGIPAYLNYWKAVTGRWSGAEIQLQNMGRGGEMRKSLIAPAGYKIGVIDLSQIEVRVLAWLAEAKVLLQVFNNKQDPYKHMATKIYNKKLEDITKSERQISKGAVLGLGYGMSAPKFQLTMKLGTIGPPVDLTMKEASRIVKVYRTTNSKIRDLWYAADEWIKIIRTDNPGEEVAHGTHKGLNFPYKEARIITHKGMYLNYHNLHREEEKDEYGRQNMVYQGANGRTKYIYGALCVENVVQHLARNIIAEQMLMIQKRYPILLSVHDEVVTLIPEDDVDEAEKYHMQCCTTNPDWCKDLPLDAEFGYDDCYSK